MSGILLVGRVEAVEGTRLRLADDLDAQLDHGDESAVEFTRAVDDYVARTGLDVPPERPVDRRRRSTCPRSGPSTWPSWRSPA